MSIDSSTPRTRRAILGGALGAAALTVVAAAGRPLAVEAVNDTHNYINDENANMVLSGQSVYSVAGSGGGAGMGTGVFGSSWGGTGVSGSSTSGTGVDAFSSSSTAVKGFSDATAQPTMLGWAHGNSTGVQGYSGTNATHAAPSRTGVYGSAQQDGTSVGVRGASTTGRGAVFSGHLAQLRLTPSTASLHPASGALGDLFLDSKKRLWFCKGGTSWVKLA